MRVLAVLAIVAFLSVAAVKAQSAADIEAALAAQRDVTIVATSTDILVTSQTHSPINRNRLEVEYMASPANQFSLFTRVFQSSSLTDAAFQFYVRFQKIVEYFELDGIPGYSAGDNKTFQQNNPINIGGITLAEDANTTDSDGNIVWNFHGTNAAGTFVIRGRQVTHETVINGQVILPSAHKFDLILAPGWTPTPGARLALIVFVDVSSSTYITPVNGTGGPGQDTLVSTVHLGDPDFPACTFNWVQNVSVVTGTDVSVADVIVSPFEIPTQQADQPTDPMATTRKIVIFSFDTIAPNSIHWDPTVALGSGSVATSSSTAGSMASTATTGSTMTGTSTGTTFNSATSTASFSAICAVVMALLSVLLA